MNARISLKYAGVGLAAAGVVASAVVLVDSQTYCDRALFLAESTAAHELQCSAAHITHAPVGETCAVFELDGCGRHVRYTCLPRNRETWLGQYGVFGFVCQPMYEGDAPPTAVPGVPSVEATRTPRGRD